MKKKQSKGIKALSLVRKHKYLILGFFVIMIIPFIILKGEVRKYMLKNNYKVINAVVVDEKNYFPNDNVKFGYSYSYEFVVNDKIYRNDSYIENLRVGDKVSVKYSPIYPNFSKLIIKEEKND